MEPTAKSNDVEIVKLGRAQLPKMQPIEIVEGFMKLIVVKDKNSGTPLNKTILHFKFNVKLLEDGSEAEFITAFPRITLDARQTGDRTWEEMVTKFIEANGGAEAFNNKCMAEYNERLMNGEPNEEDNEEPKREEESVALKIDGEKVRDLTKPVKANGSGPSNLGTTTNSKVPAKGDIVASIDDAVAKASVTSSGKRKGSEQLEEPPVKKSKTATKAVEAPQAVTVSQKKRKDSEPEPEPGVQSQKKSKQVTFEEPTKDVIPESQKEMEQAGVHEATKSDKSKKPAPKKKTNSSIPEVDIVEELERLDFGKTPFNDRKLRPTIGGDNEQDFWRLKSKMDERFAQLFKSKDLAKKGKITLEDLPTYDDIYSESNGRPYMYQKPPDTCLMGIYGLLGLTTAYVRGYIAPDDIIVLNPLSTSETKTSWSFDVKLLNLKENGRGSGKDGACIKYAVFLSLVDPETIYNKTKDLSDMVEGDYGVPVTANLMDLAALYIEFERQKELGVKAKISNCIEVFMRSKVKRTGLSLWALINSGSEGGRKYIEAKLKEYRETDTGFLDTEIKHTKGVIEERKAIAQTPKPDVTKQSEPVPQKQAAKAKKAAEPQKNVPAKEEQKPSAKKVVETPVNEGKQEKSEPKQRTTGSDPKPKALQAPVKDQTEEASHANMPAPTKIPRGSTKTNSTEVIDLVSNVPTANALLVKETPEAKESVATDLSYARTLKKEVVALINSFDPKYNLPSDASMDQIVKKMEEIKAQKVRSEREASKVTQMQQEVDSQMEKIAQLEAEKKFILEESGRRNDVHSQETKELKAKLNTLNAQLASTKESYESATVPTEEYEKLQGEYKELQSELDGTANTLKSLEAKLEKLVPEHKKAIEDAKKLEFELASANSSRVQMEGELKNTRIQISGLTKDIANYKTLVDGSQEMTDSLQALAKSLASNAELANAIATSINKMKPNKEDES